MGLAMSALTLEADIRVRVQHVCFVHQKRKSETSVDYFVGAQ
jgi:hypothetical protein